MTTKTTNNFNLSPFLLKPVFAKRVWGKTDLRPWYEETGTTEKVGEAWLTGPDCVIDGGAEDGRTLGDLAAQCVGSLGNGEFPLLVKMLFPSEKLSVQVHPDDVQANKAGLPRGKTECWYVLEAYPGATVACGLKSGLELADVEKAIRDATLEQLLEFLPVSVGDMIFVDAGTVHAIGPGVVLLEVQQTSDVTYRLFDYGRPRELHLEAGLGVVKMHTDAGKITAKPMDKFTRLVESKYFVVDRFDLAAGQAVEMPMDGVGCVVGLRGTGAVNEVQFVAGQAVVVPFGSVTMTSRDGTSFVRCFTPEN